MGPGIPVRQRSNTRNHVGPGCGAGGRWRGLAAVPVGGGRAWPGFETTRRAKLAARTASGRAAAHRHAKQPGPQLGVTVPGMPAVLQATLWAGRRPPARQAARHAKQLGTPSSPARQAARHAKQPGTPSSPAPTARCDGARSTRGTTHHRRQSARIRSQQRRQVDAPAARELGCLGAAREAVRQIHRVRLRIKRGQQRMRCDRD